MSYGWGQSLETLVNDRGIFLVGVFKKVRRDFVWPNEAEGAFGVVVAI